MEKITLFGKIKKAKFLFQNTFLQAAATVIEQNTTAVENLYPRQKPKIRLANEKIMIGNIMSGSIGVVKFHN